MSTPGRLDTDHRLSDLLEQLAVLDARRATTAFSERERVQAVRLRLLHALQATAAVVGLCDVAVLLRSVS